MPQPVIFSLTRHAATVWNLEKRIQGHGDSPLSPQGMAAARLWAANLRDAPFDRALCSDLPRVKQTFDILNESLNIPVIYDRRLREQHFGRWTGKRWNEIARRDLETQVARGWDFRPPGGESRTEVLGRSREALLETAARFPGDAILVVCHEGVLKSLLYFLFRREYLPDEPKLLKASSMHRIVVEGGILRADAINLSLEKDHHS